MSAAAHTFVVPEGFAVDLRRAAMLKQAQESAQRTGSDLIDALLQLGAAQQEGVAAHARWVGQPLLHRLESGIGDIRLLGAVGSKQCPHRLLG